MVRRFSNFEEKVNLPLGQILIFSATICATDSVAALTMIKPEKYPKLFSVIFGEVKFFYKSNINFIYNIFFRGWLMIRYQLFCLLQFIIYSPSKESRKISLG